MSESRSRRRVAALALPLALAAAGCVTRAGEAKLGGEEAQRVERELGLVRDGALEGYVAAVGGALAAASELPGGPWSFEVIDQPEPNAFSLPGGHVYVTRGLLALLNSEDELAGVLGHEIAHVTARHAAKRIGAAAIGSPVAIGAGIAGLAIGMVSPLLGDAVAGTGQILTSGLVVAPFSREQEHEADEIGQTLAARVGYDPAALASFLQTLDREATLEAGKPRSFHFLDSHPTAPDRAKRCAERAQQLERGASRAVAGTRRGFLARIDGIVVGEDPAQGVVRENLFLHPELEFAIRFPSGWKIHNAATLVGAVSPKEDALVALQLAATGSNLDAVVEQLQKEQPELRFERIDLGGLPAARSRVESRGRIAEITLIGYRGSVYATIGQCEEGVAKAALASFDATARSFRALRADERASIHESRLRAREARAGETPADFAKRSGSSWKPEELAVANAVDVAGSFAAGSLVKVALPQAYTARGR